jgi:acetyl-CoA C-acetyltransferase
MRKFGTTEEQLAAVAAKNRSRALKNPKALFKRMISVNDVMQSKKIVEPLKLLDCSAPCCGASAVIMVSERKAKSCDKPVWIKGIGQQTNSASFANSTSDLTRIDAASIASREAFKMARTRPSQIDIAEVHDAFSIIEILAMEDIGFVKRGEGGLHVGKTHQVINPRGGILGSGHPVGATGVAQTAEIVNQLQGKAGLSQVTGCKMGLVHNLAAAGSSATVLILGADQ